MQFKLNYLKMTDVPDDSEFNNTLQSLTSLTVG